MNTIIIYGSHHHGNTKKLAVAISEAFGYPALDAENEIIPCLDSFDHIIFASGIDFNKFYSAVTETAKKLSPGKKVSVIYTCASVSEKLGGDIRAIAAERGCTCLGTYGCKGHNSYGPWKLIGGMNKAHPTKDEIDGAIDFVRTVEA